jgi:hypothetical protein
MIITNLNNGKILIKHETCVDPDNEFLLMENLSDKSQAFDEFFKKSLEQEHIAVQIVEFVDNTVQFSDYFSSKKIWQDGEVWNDWYRNFKNTHSFYLYFYNPKGKKKEFYTGSIDMDSYPILEYFEIKDYFANESDRTSTFEIHVDTDVIYNCLTKSTVEEFQSLLREFELKFLNKDLNDNLVVNPKNHNKVKI